MDEDDFINYILYLNRIEEGFFFCNYFLESDFLCSETYWHFKEIFKVL